MKPWAQHPLKASALREPSNLPGLCHIGHMDGVDTTGIGPRALDLCTVLEHRLSCPHGGCNETKQEQLEVSQGERKGPGRHPCLLCARCWGQGDESDLGRIPRGGDNELGPEYGAGVAQGEKGKVFQAEGTAYTKGPGVCREQGEARRGSNHTMRTGLRPERALAGEPQRSRARLAQRVTKEGDRKLRLQQGSGQP